jgi:predicted nuclease with TOPRIM domain
MDSNQDSEIKIKKLEMNVAQLQKRVGELEDDVEEMKRYLIKIVSNQSAIGEKIRMWPYVVVSSQDNLKK